MNPDIYKLLIVDDHPIVAEGIVASLHSKATYYAKA